MLRTRQDSSISVAQIVVEYDGVDSGGGGDGKLVEKLLKIEKLSKSLKSLKGLKNLRRLLVRRIVYQSTDPPSIRYKELELSLKI